MSLYEFTEAKVVDVYALSLHILQKYLNENKQFMGESAYDYTEYRKIIDYEKLHTVPLTHLVVGEQYVPMSVTGTPVGKMLMYFLATEPVMFDSIDSRRTVFKDAQDGNHLFPPKDQELGDSCIDVLIFKSIEEREQFLSVVRLKFCDWHISEYQV